MHEERVGEARGRTAAPSGGGQADSGVRTARELLRGVAEQAATHPFRTVAAAVGAGYVVGGGLFSPLTARLFGVLVRIGLRAAALPLLDHALGLLAGPAGAKQSNGEATSETKGTRT
jgi:hypothetical protein